MAPYSGYKKHVKFAKTRSPAPRKKIPSSADSYANIVLHYLSKLKGLFQPSRTPLNESTTYLRRGYHDPSKSILKNRGAESDSETRQKVHDIVNAAIQYGCANNIIEKVGNYFLVRNRSEQISSRRPTPGPDYVRCDSCKNLTKYRSRHQRRCSAKTPNYRKRSSKYEVDSRRTASSKRRRKHTRNSLVNYCPKCYARLKSSRRF